MATGIGDTLRTARRQQGRTLADASAETCVRETYLAALEEEEFSAVGGHVYVKGFIKSYARYLGVDPDPLLDQFRAEHERPEDRATFAQQPLPPVGPVGPMGPMGERQPPSRMVVIGGIVLGILIALGIIGLLGGGEQEPASLAPEPVDASREAVAPAPNVAPSEFRTLPAPVEPELVPFEDIVVQLRITSGESYIRTDAGQPRVEGVKEAGFIETFRNGSADQVSFRIGDASRVQLVVNGRDLGQLGDRGDVVDVTCEVGETACDISNRAR